MESMKNLTRGGVCQQVSQTQRNRKLRYQFEWTKISGIGKYGKQFRKRHQESGGKARLCEPHGNQGQEQQNQARPYPPQEKVTKESDLPNSPEHSLLQMALSLNSTKAIDNWRTQAVMGIYRKDGKATTAESIPDKANRSRFSCERYQFFLDAPFEIGKQCCDHLKKAPLKKYQKESGHRPILATMASESRLRTQAWLANGCNAFDAKDKKSTPLAFWFDQDILQYIYIYKDELIEWRKKEYIHKLTKLDIDHVIDYKAELKKITTPINPVYGEVVVDYGNQLEGQMRLDDLSPDFGVFDLERPTYKTTGLKRTGCFACGYGMHHEKKENSRIQGIIDFSNPKLADWMLRGGHFNEKGLWEPYQGCGMWFPLMWCEKYGGLKYYIPNREYYLEKYSTPETDYYLKN